MTARYRTEAPDPEWTDRWADAPFNPAAWAPDATGRDAAVELRARLVALGGWAVCVRDRSLPPTLLAHGGDVPGEGAEMREGLPRECHDNSRALVDADPTLVWHYGYALSEDGMWREHSWCVKPDGGVVETTVARVAYFGAPERG